jgi:hypothetical protein
MKQVIDKITIEGKDYIPAEQYKDYFNEFNGLESLLGMKIFIRTVTYHCIGKMVGLKDGFIQLEDSAWVADSGRFADALEKGTLNEVEPTKKMWVAVSSIVDFFEWKHDLPLKQK